MSTPKRTFYLPGLLVAAAMLLLSACGAASQAEDRSYGRVASSAPEPAMEMGFDESERGGNSFSGSVPSETQRLVIKNADISIVVIDPPSSMERISQLAEELGGYVVTANLHQTRLDSGQEVPRGSMTIRVPAEDLDAALERIEAESDRLPLSRNISSQDVTREYTDLESRLRNLESAEAQLQEIMASAFQTEDVLEVYNELVQVREQIEVIKGQMQYYKQSAALSAISIELIANEAVQPLSIGGWQPVGVAKDAVQTLIDTLKFLANAAIWVVLYLTPVLAVIYVVLVLPLSLVWRYWRKRRAQRNTAPSTPSEEANK